MKSSFNAFGKTKKVYDAGSTPVWLGTVTPVPKGGVLESSCVVPGNVIPAGTPVCFDHGEIYPIPVFSIVEKISAKKARFRMSHLSAAAEFIPEPSETLVVTRDFSSDNLVEKNAITEVEKVNDGEYIITSSEDFNKDEYALADGEGYIISPVDVPNAYLYNDIVIGDIDASEENVEAGIASATGAVVMYHAEGILIDRTPAAPIAEAMAKAVPGVLQVKG